MLVNPKFVNYSDFYLNVIIGGDDVLYKHYRKYKLFATNTLLPKKVGMFGRVSDTNLHPLYHDCKQQFSDINIPKIKSRLSRNRYLSNKKHKDDWNDNYRQLFHNRHLFQNDYSSYEEYEKAWKLNKDVSVTPYGTADNPNQIYNRLNFLNRIKDRQFFISVDYIHKEILADGESSYGGYRQHKNGGYFGTKLLEHEYLADEEQIKDGIFSFHINEVKPTKCENIREENFIFVKSRPNSHHHYVFDARNDSMLIGYVYWEDGQIQFGDGSTKLIKYEHPTDEQIDYKKLNDEIFKVVDDFESKHNV